MKNPHSNQAYNILKKIKEERKKSGNPVKSGRKSKAKSKALESMKRGMGGSGHNNLPAGHKDSDNE